jgi:hypothetical protein
MCVLRVILESAPSPPLVRELCGSEFDAMIARIGSCLELVQGTEPITMATEFGRAHPIWHQSSIA